MLPAVSEHRPVEMVDLFAGPGGLDVAARWLGIETVGIEFDSNACATRAKAGLGTIQSDVTKRSPSEFRGAKILAGGPPCQTYSVAGTGAGRERLEHILDLARRMGASKCKDVEPELDGLDDIRTGLVLEPLKWALQAMRRGHAYETIILEQVPTVLPVWDTYAEILRGAGYFAKARVLSAEEYGVPQTRRRAILIARLKYPVVWPKKTHRKFTRGATPGIGEDGRRSWVSMQQALGRQDEFVVVSNYGTGGVPSARGKRRFDEPAYTVTGKVSRNRVVDSAGDYIAHISVPDAGRLQTFPQDYPWSGLDVSQQVGNAIPPRLAAHVLSVAVFGKQLSTDALDAAVSSPWEVSKEGVSGLRPVKQPGPEDAADPECAENRQLALISDPLLTA
ncbi:DNA cytosine methyltransferase [Nocardia fluminea]|uniref:DNA cytosine methyltransferase n=1 Tax=Nocardia fluminea TaxID=134984 RepID=UPI0033FF574A